MRYYLGAYERKIDSKNRILIPEKILKVYYKIENNGIEERIEGMKYCLNLFLWGRYLCCMNPSIFDKQNLKIKNIKKSNIDKKNRILIPGEFYTKLNLENKVAIVGMSFYFEIWNPEHFEEYLEEYKKTVYKTE